jgi:hypothetical protein
MLVESDAFLSFPRALVFSTYRDRLPELVPYLPNVRSIQTQSRHEDGDKVELANLWQGSGDDIPAIARGVLKPEMLSWIDRACWTESDHTCRWRIESPVLKDSIQCHGTTTFTEDGSRTRVRITGDLSVNAKGIPFIPKLLASKIVPVVERYIVSAIRPNLTSVAGGVDAFLQAGRGYLSPAKPD